MKTDRFSDIIRRKLESIRPEFSEKDWTRMQASLQTGIPQPGTPSAGIPFTGSLWTAKPWLMAAATVSAVVLVGYGFWQHTEINHLRQTIGQLSRKAKQQTTANQQPPAVSGIDTVATTPLAESHSQAGREAFPTSVTPQVIYQRERDTVYITRYVSVPARSHAVPPENERSTDPSNRLMDQRYAATERRSEAITQPDQSDNLLNNPKTNAYGEPSTSSSVTNKNAANSSETGNRYLDRRSKGRRSSGQYAYNQPTKGNYASPDQRTLPTNSAPTTGWSHDKGLINAVPASTESGVVDPAEAATSANYEPIDLPAIATPTINWAGQLAQRARRMRPARTTVVSGAVEQTAPENQPTERMAGRFRAGLGGDLASKVLSAGVFAEVLLGPKKNWSISVGLSQASYDGKFANDYDFDERMKRNFRKEFAIDPRREIYNIDTRTTRIQVPVNIGYRVSLNQALALSPSVGTLLNLSSSEHATFFCPAFIPKRGFDEFNSSTPRPVDLITSVVFGAGLEWQSRHWVFQGSPVLTLPLQTSPLPMQPGSNWQTEATVGLRARVLYQF